MRLRERGETTSLLLATTLLVISMRSYLRQGTFFRMSMPVVFSLVGVFLSPFWSSNASREDASGVVLKT